MRLNRRFRLFACCAVCLSVLIYGRHCLYCVYCLRHYCVSCGVFSFILPFSRVLRHFYSFADSFLTYMRFSCLNRRYCVLLCSAFFGCFINDC